MAITGTLGAKLSITDAAIASTIDSEAEFSAQSWTEVGLIESFGEFGRVFAPVNFQAISDGRMYKLKGGFDDGDIQFVLGQDLADDGQFILSTAANLSTQDNYGIKIELNDAETTTGGPTVYYLRGLVMSYRTTMGSVNNVVKANSTVSVNSTIIRSPPSDLYDRFITGGSLTHYELFNGTDPQAADAVISANTLVLVSGDDAAADVATNGSQVIGDTGYTLSAGPVVVEAKVKISAITLVQAYFGLTDQKTALEIPIQSAAAADTITTNATDAVGFMFDTAMATDDIWLVGVNAGVDETSQNSGLAFVADTYKTLRIEVAANGNAVFYIDGVAIGTAMTTAVATNVPLYPTLLISSLTTVARTETADYLYARQDT